MRWTSPSRSMPEGSQSVDRPPIVVVGGRGHLGDPLCRRLASIGFGVVSIDVASGAPRRGITDRHFGHADRAGLAEAFVGADVVVHLAVDGGYRDDDEDVHQRSVDGLRNVLDAAAAAGVRRLVYTSSIQVYGWVADDDRFAPDRLPVDEDNRFAPTNHYGRAKVAGEELAALYTDRIEVVIFRPTWVAGRTDAARLWATNGSRPRSSVPNAYVHVDDAVDAMVAAFSPAVATPVTLLLSADDSTSAEPLIEFYRREMPELVTKAVHLQGVASALSNQKAKAVLGWQPRRSWRRPPLLDRLRAFARWSPWPGRRIVRTAVRAVRANRALHFSLGGGTYYCIGVLREVAP